MKAKLLLAVPLLFSAAVVSAEPFGCHNAEPRRVVAPAAGVSRIVIIGAAGSLKVTGRSGGDVVATGTACSSDKDYLKDIQLTARRNGAELRIEAIVPGQTFSFGWSAESRLDFEVTLPDSVPVVIHDGSGEAMISNTSALEVEDGSGELTIRNIKGSLKVTDGSGSLTIKDVAGDVRVDDGSGSVEIERVGGSVYVEDGSGSIDVKNVQKNVTVADDGSGGVDVRDVRGDFAVEHKGTGAVDYERVGGKVSIPHRR